MPDAKGRPPRRVLISCLRLLGDVVLSLPLLDMVKTEHPDCEVDYLVPAGMGDFLRCDPRVRRVIEHRRGGRSYLWPILMRYDWAFGTNGSDRSVISVAAAGVRKRIAQVDAVLPLGERWKRLALTHPTEMPSGKPVIKWCAHLARAAGLHPTRIRASVHWTPAHETRVRALLRGADVPKRGHFVLHPFSRHPYKEWPMDRVVEASDRIAHEHGLRPVWTGSASERDRRLLADAASRASVAPVVCAGTLDLNAVACMVAQARLFVGVDTAITHLAAATDTPLVALYGPTAVRGWAPWNNRNPLDHDFPWAPGSFRNGHVSVLQDAEAFDREFSPSMDMQKPSASMAAITLEQVVAEARHLLREASVHSAP
jgi:heptosyltransferase-3